ncbi:MAG TPA: thiamine pyrophosphate-binding protein [Dehalococcoidia bacterium]|nr:thiamine pyrophosphate-binding protein [Dehalococcoidia bacterium]
MSGLTAKHAVMEQFLAEGVKHIFGNPGSTELAFMDALQDYPQLQYILCLHETTAVAAADGYARASGRPAVVNVHIAPGLANALSMIYNARKGGTPLVVTVGQQDTRYLLTEPALSEDLVRLGRPWTKWAVEVNRGDDVPMVLRRAFKVAAEPPRGPVLVSLPQNVMDYPVSEPVIPTTYTSWRTRPDPEAVERAAALLAEARRPLVLSGDAMALSGAHPEVAALAELLGAPVMAGSRRDWNFPTDHPHYLGGFNIMGGARQALGGFDAILAVGTGNLFSSLWYEGGSPLPEDAVFIHIDLDSWQIAKNYPVTMGIIADPKQAARDLLIALEKRMSPGARRDAQARSKEIVQTKERAREQTERQLQAEWRNKPISPLRLMSELKALIKPHTAFVGGGGTSGSGALAAMIDLAEPNSFFGGGASLGFGLPGTLGVKLAMPDRPVVGVIAEGDGMYSNQALWTAAHHHIPVTYVIVNNASYRILKINMVRYLGEQARKSQFMGMDFGDPPLDYAKLASVWGIPSARVENPDDLGPALKQALDHDGPSLVDVMVDGSYGDHF